MTLPSLHLTRLRLTDFRNYGAAELTLDARPVVLAGPNGAGKTNLLEAVSMLSPGRGLRRAKLEALRRRPGETTAPAWGVMAELIRAGEEHHVTTGVAPEAPNRRVVKIDGTNAPASDFTALIPMVWLTPAQDRLFAAPAGARRRFLDRLTLAAAPGHARAASVYEKAMRERQRLLDNGIRDHRWLTALEARMAEAGAEMAASRAATVQRLRRQIEASPDTAFPTATLDLSGALEEAVLAGEGVEDLQARFVEKLREVRQRDEAAGRALSGPHRSDLLVAHAEKDSPASQGSTGEQKALLTGLILAQARALAADHGVAPLVLLDEAAAHLDPDRRAALIAELSALGAQAWLTGVESRLFNAFEGGAQRFYVAAGSITPEP